MRWEELLSAKRCRGGQTRGRNAKSSDLRSEFEKDYHRIIGSASFRRLQDKTQVFPLDKSDFIRTRLTHSLEVSSFAKSLGQNIGENILVYKKDSEFTPQMKEDICNILQCAGQHFLYRKELLPCLLHIQEIPSRCVRWQNLSSVLHGYLNESRTFL